MSYDDYVAAREQVFEHLREKAPRMVKALNDLQECLQGEEWVISAAAAATLLRIYLLTYREQMNPNASDSFKRGLEAGLSQSADAIARKALDKPNAIRFISSEPLGHG